MALLVTTTLSNVEAPVTPRVPPTMALLVTTTLSNVEAPVTLSSLFKVDLPCTSISSLFGPDNSKKIELSLCNLISLPLSSLK